MPIDIDSYPELKLICWDVHCKTISRKHAFLNYINRWGYVHKDRLTIAEHQLINQLTRECGRGHFFPRAHGRAKITKDFLEHAIAIDEIDPAKIDSFVESISPDPSYPGVINGKQYYWRAEVDAFLTTG